MATEGLIWLLPWMVLRFGVFYAAIVAWGAVYGFAKSRSGRSLMRDVLIIVTTLAASYYGLTTEHSVIGLLIFSLACGMSLVLHSAEFSKTNDMAPFGYVTSFSIITSILVISGILTSEL
jgi:hypothetical protein